MKVISLVFIVLLLTGCAVCPPATEKNVNKWMNKNKFKASRECDSLRHLKMLAMSRKF